MDKTDIVNNIRDNSLVISFLRLIMYFQPLGRLSQFPIALLDKAENYNHPPLPNSLIDPLVYKSRIISTYF